MSSVARGARQILINQLILIYSHWSTLQCVSITDERLVTNYRKFGHLFNKVLLKKQLKYFRCLLHHYFNSS